MKAVARGPCVTVLILVVASSSLKDAAACDSWGYADRVRGFSDSSQACWEESVLSAISTMRGHGGRRQAGGPRAIHTLSLDLGYTLTVGLLTNGLSC